MRASILILEDDDDMRTALDDVVSTLLGWPCVAVASYDELLERSEEALGCSMALLDVNLGADQPSGLDALDWLLRQGFRGQVVFLTGHAQSDPLVQETLERGTVRLMEKPIGLSQLSALLDEGLPRHEGP
ncbi:MAG TPA: response regulator [Polyangia bacterium]|nr:response regulator [Polyangia bacterium]